MQQQDNPSFPLQDNKQHNIKPSFMEYVEGRNGGQLAVSLLQEYNRNFPEASFSELEIKRLKNSLEEARNDVAIYKEWWERAEKNIGILSSQLEELKNPRLMAGG